MGADVPVLVTWSVLVHGGEADWEGSCWDWEAGVLSVHLLQRMDDSLMPPYVL